VIKRSKKAAVEPVDPEYVKNIEPGMKAQVFQNPYFGWTGVVDRVSESSIFVRFGLNDKVWRYNPLTF